MEWIIHLLRQHSELAIFLTIAAGFWIGKMKIKQFSLGIVTSVLLVGVLVGQLNITIEEPVKSVFFLLFLFAIGYKVGPQFFRGLKKDGLPQVGFAVLMCVGCLVITWLLAILMGYNAGEAAGLLAGAQTISAVIGVAEDTINGLNIASSQKSDMINIIPVAYAVTYIFGTAGSAWVLSSLGPKMLGGLEKVKAACKELETRMGTSEAAEPGFEQARRPVVFRAYRIENDWFGNGKTVDQLESYFISQGKRLFVERMRHGSSIVNDIIPGQLLQKGDEVVLSGRREFAIGEEDWIGEEIVDPQLLDFPVEVLPVMIHKKPYSNQKLDFIRRQSFMHGVSIRRIKRAGIDIPVFAQTTIDCGDTLELVGLKKEVESAAKELGYIDRPTNATDMTFVGLGILLGGIIGALAIHIGQIPESSLWVLNNVGLNIFIAVVGISAGPRFVQGLKEVGPMLFIIGALATSLPLLLGLILARYVFKFHPALSLGSTAGARTTTAALGAIQEAVGSETPSLGYTVTYAVGNTLLIIWGVIIVLLIN